MQWTYLAIFIQLQGFLQVTSVTVQGQLTKPKWGEETSTSSISSQRRSSHSADHKGLSSPSKGFTRELSTVIDLQGSYKLDNSHYKSKNERKHRDLGQKREKRRHEEITESAPLEEDSSRRQVNGTIYAPEWDQLTWSDNEEESQGSALVDEGSGEAVELTTNATHENEVQTGPPKIAKEKESGKKARPKFKNETPQGNGEDHFLDIVSEAEEGGARGKDDLKKGIEAFKGRLERLIRLYHQLKGDAESSGSPVFADQKSTASDKHQVEKNQPSLDDLRRLVRILQAYPMYYRSAFKEGKSEEDMEPNVGGDTFEVWVDSKPKGSATYDANYKGNDFHLFDKRTKIPAQSKNTRRGAKNLSPANEGGASKLNSSLSKKRKQSREGRTREKRRYETGKNLAEEMHDAARAVHREIQRQSEASEQRLKKIINQLKRHHTMAGTKVHAGNVSYAADKKSDLRHPIRSLDNGLLYMSDSDNEASDKENDLMSLENQVEANDAENLLAKKQATLEAAENALWSDDALIKRNDFRNFLVRNYINYLHHAGPILSDEVRTWGRIASDQSKELQHIHDVFQNYQKMDAASQQRWLGLPDLNLTPENQESGMYGFMNFHRPERRLNVPVDSALFEKIRNSDLDPSNDILRADHPSFHGGSLASHEDESAAFRDSFELPYGTNNGKLMKKQLLHRAYVTSPPNVNDYYQFSAPINDPASDRIPSRFSGQYGFEPVPVFQREIPEGYAFNGNDNQSPLLAQNLERDSTDGSSPFVFNYDTYSAMSGRHSDLGERLKFLDEGSEKDPARYTGTLPLVAQLQDEFRQFQNPKPAEFSHTESEVRDFPIPSKRSNILGTQVFGRLNEEHGKKHNFLKANEIDAHKKKQQFKNSNFNSTIGEREGHRYKKAMKHQTIIRVGLPSEEPGKKGELSQSVQPVSPEMSMLQDVDLARYSDSRDDGEFIRVLPRERFHNSVPLVAGRHISGGRNGPWVLNRVDTTLRGLGYMDRIPSEAVAVLQGLKRDNIPREATETEDESKDQSQSIDRDSFETFLHSNEVRKRSKVTGRSKGGRRGEQRKAKPSHRERREANLINNGRDGTVSTDAYDALKTNDIMGSALPFADDPMEVKVHNAELQDTTGRSYPDIPFRDSSDDAVIPSVQDSKAAIEERMSSMVSGDSLGAYQDAKNSAIEEGPWELKNREITQSYKVSKVPFESPQTIPNRSANNMTIGTDEKRGKVALKKIKTPEPEASSIRPTSKALPQVIGERSLAVIFKNGHRLALGGSHLRPFSSLARSGDNVSGKTEGSAADQKIGAKFAGAGPATRFDVSKDANAPFSSKVESSDKNRLANATFGIKRLTPGAVICRRSTIPDLKRLAQEVKGRTVRKVIRKIKDIRLTDNLSHEVVKFITGKLLREIDLPDFDLDHVAYVKETTKSQRTRPDRPLITKQDISEVTDFSENLGDAKRAFIPMGSLSKNMMGNSDKVKRRPVAAGQRSSLVEQIVDASKSDALFQSLEPSDKEFEDALYEDLPLASLNAMQKSEALVGKTGRKKGQKRMRKLGRKGRLTKMKQRRPVKGLKKIINVKNHKNVRESAKKKSRKHLYNNKMTSSNPYLSPSVLDKTGITPSNTQGSIRHPLISQGIAASSASQVIKGKPAVHTRSQIFPFPLHVHRFPVRNTLHGYLFPVHNLHHNSLLRRKLDPAHLRATELQLRNGVKLVVHGLETKLAPKEAVDLLYEIQGPSVFQSTNLRTGKLDLEAVKKMRTGKTESLVPSLMIKSTIEGTTQAFRQSADYETEGARKDKGRSLGSAMERLPWKRKKEVGQTKNKKAEKGERPVVQPQLGAKEEAINSSSISSLKPSKTHLDAKLKGGPSFESKKAGLKMNQTNALTKSQRKKESHGILHEHVTPDRILSQIRAGRNADVTAVSNSQNMQPAVVVLATTHLQNITVFPSNRSEDESTDNGAKSDLAMTLAGIPRITRLKLASLATKPDNSKGHEVHFESLKEDNPVPKDPKEAFLEEIRIQVASNASMDASKEPMMDEGDRAQESASELDQQSSDPKAQLGDDENFLHLTHEETKAKKYNENATQGTNHPYADSKGHQASDREPMSTESVLSQHHAGGSVQKGTSKVQPNEIKVTFTNVNFQGHGKQNKIEESRKAVNKSTTKKKPESSPAMRKVAQLKEKTEKKQKEFEKEATFGEIYADDLTTTAMNEEKEDQKSGSEASWSEGTGYSAPRNTTTLGFRTFQKVISLKEEGNNQSKPKPQAAESKKTGQNLTMQNTHLEADTFSGDESHLALTGQKVKGQTMSSVNRRVDSEFTASWDMDESGDEKTSVKPYYLLAKNKDKWKKGRKLYSKIQSSFSRQGNQSTLNTILKLKDVEGKNSVELQTQGQNDKEFQFDKEEAITSLTSNSARNETKHGADEKDVGKNPPATKKNGANFVPKAGFTPREEVSSEEKIVNDPEEDVQTHGLYSLRHKNSEESRNEMIDEKQDNNVSKYENTNKTNFPLIETSSDDTYSGSFVNSLQSLSNNGESHDRAKYLIDSKVVPDGKNRLRKHTLVNMSLPLKASHNKSVKPDRKTDQGRSRIIFIKNGQAVSPGVLTAVANRKESSGKRSVSIATNGTQSLAPSPANNNGSEQQAYLEVTPSNTSASNPGGDLVQAQQQQLESGTKEHSNVVEHIADYALAVDPDSDGKAVKQQLESETAKDLDDMFLVAQSKDGMQGSWKQPPSGSQQDQEQVQESHSANRNDAAEPVPSEDSPLPPYKAISPAKLLESEVKPDSVDIGKYAQNGNSTYLISNEPKITASYPLVQTAKQIPTENSTLRNQGLAPTETVQQVKKADTVHEVMKRSLPDNTDFGDDVKRDLTRPLWFSDDIPEVNEATHVNAIEKLIEGTSDDDLRLDSLGSEAPAQDENEDDPPIA